MNYDAILANLPIYLMRIPAVLIAITVHESAHAWVSWKLGDSTAKDHGRISLNPLRHLQPVGVLMMILLGFGFAKPVLIDARRFKRPKVGMALTALAGPVSNLLLGFVGVFLFECAAYSPLWVRYQSGDNFAWAVLLFLELFYSINIYLAIFNLIPIPPLDGSRILLLILPEKIYFRIMRYERYLFYVILLLSLTGILSGFLNTVFGWIENAFFWIFHFLPFLS